MMSPAIMPTPLPPRAAYQGVRASSMTCAAAMIALLMNNVPLTPSTTTPPQSILGLGRLRTSAPSRIFPVWSVSMS